MNKRNLIAIAIAAVTIFSTGIVIAHPQGGREGQRRDAMQHRPAGGPFSHLGILKDKLALSDQQVTEIRGIFDDLRTRNAQYREQLRDSRGDGIDALLQNPNDVAAVQAISDRKAEAHRAMRANTIAATAKALKVLNAEQRAKLAGMIEERRERREDRRERREERRGL